MIVIKLLKKLITKSNKSYSGVYLKLFDPFQFKLATLGEGEYKGYYVISKDILTTNKDVLISQTDFRYIEVDKIIPTFGKTSIFKYINNAIKKSQQIIIGGKSENSIEVEDFNSWLDAFAGSRYYFVNRYIPYLISHYFQDYFDGLSSQEEKFSKYTKKYIEKLQGFNSKKHKKNKYNNKNTTEDIDKELKSYEVEKLKTIKAKLETMIENCSREDVIISEADWCQTIKPFIPLLFPKYMYAISEISIPYENGRNGRVDFVLVDQDGFIDFMEVKLPYYKSNENIKNAISLYAKDRNNYTPRDKLPKAIMQLEKYIYHAKKSSSTLEKQIKEKIEQDIEIKVVNPRGIVLIGVNFNKYEEDYNTKQFDLEIIKRQYNNISDILTYDDIIARLENTIKALEPKTDKYN